jgi:hypothetical protein
VTRLGTTLVGNDQGEIISKSREMGIIGMWPKLHQAAALITLAAATQAGGLHEVRPLCFGASVARLCGVKVSNIEQTAFCGRRILCPMSQRREVEGH